MPRSETCRAARKGLAFYVRRTNERRAKMGQAVPPVPPLAACPGPYLVKLWQRKARAARRAFERWHRYHYAWREWLPAKWVRIARCETGLRWDWNSGTYQGAFGFYRGSWDAFVPHAARKARPYPSEAYLATPRQQYEVALAIWRRYGFSGWGCREEWRDP